MKNNIKIALCVGHNKRHKGAFSLYLNSTEYDYNTRVANLVKKALPDNVVVFNRFFNSGYNSEIEELASRVNTNKFDLVIELHFNSAVPNVSGVESLYFRNSEKGKIYAESFCKAISDEYNSNNRGAKSLRGSTNRGYLFVQKMKAPAIIVEPFFGSNTEARQFINVTRYANTLINWINCL